MAPSKLVVKHTFLELDASPEEASPVKPRRQTEPAIFGEWLRDSDSDDEISEPTREPSSGDITVSGSADNSPRNDSDASNPAFLVSATPEATPMFCPQPYAPELPQWAEAGLMQQFTGMEYFMLPDQCATEGWWAPMQFSYNSELDRGSQIVFGEFVEAGEHSTASLTVGAEDAFLENIGTTSTESWDLAKAVTTSRESWDAMTTAEHEAEAEAASRWFEPSTSQDLRTTVMIRNLPEGYTAALLLELLNSQGFVGRFDFMYVPIDFKRQVNLGYAFINLTSPDDAQCFCMHFKGFCDWGMPCDAPCTVSWSDPHQGLIAHVERYRNSPVMHESVPKDWKPLLFKNGVPVPFPKPTKNIKAPKIKSSS